MFWQAETATLKKARVLADVNGRSQRDTDTASCTTATAVPTITTTASSMVATVSAPTTATTAAPMSIASLAATRQLKPESAVSKEALGLAMRQPPAKTTAAGLGASGPLALGSLGLGNATGRSGVAGSSSSTDGECKQS